MQNTYRNRVLTSHNLIRRMRKQPSCELRMLLPDPNGEPRIPLNKAPVAGSICNIDEEKEATDLSEVPDAGSALVRLANACNAAAVTNVLSSSAMVWFKSA